jgi:hypothetical protein
MRYRWLAHYQVQRCFPELDRKTQEEIISEAVCRAWCTFLVPDYRLMQACVNAAAKRKGLLPSQAIQLPRNHPPEKTYPRTQKPQTAAVIQISDYRATRQR